MQHDWGAKPELPEQKRGFKWVLTVRKGWQLSFEFVPKGSVNCGEPKVNVR